MRYYDAQDCAVWSYRVLRLDERRAQGPETAREVLGYQAHCHADILPISSCKYHFHVFSATFEICMSNLPFVPDSSARWKAVSFMVRTNTVFHRCAQEKRN